MHDKSHKEHTPSSLITQSHLTLTQSFNATTNEDEEVMNHIIVGSAIFIDHDSSEIMLWNHCLPVLLNECGALTVQDLQQDHDWISAKQLHKLFILKQHECMYLANENQSQTQSSSEDTHKEENEQDDEEEDDDWDNNDWDNDDDDDDDEKNDDRMVNTKASHQTQKDNNNNKNNINSNKRSEQIPANILHYYLSHPKYDDERVNRAVFFLNSISPDNERQIRRCIQHYAFTEVTVLCLNSDSFCTYFQTIHENYLTYSDLNEKLTLWILEAQQRLALTNNQNQKKVFNENEVHPVVNIRQLPLNYAAITHDAFLLPTCSHVFPSLDNTVTKMSAISTVSHNNDSSEDKSLLSEEKRVQYIQLAHAMRDFCESTRMQGEIYSLGASSHFIADHLQGLLADYPISDSELTKKASFFILDRTLDLVTPMIHSDNLIDRIMQHQSSDTVAGNVHSDISLEKSFFSNAHEEASLNPTQISLQTSSLVHNGNPRIISLIQNMISNYSDDLYPIIKQELLSLLSDKERKKVLESISSKSKEKQIQLLFETVMGIPSVALNHLELLQFICVVLDIIFKTEIDSQGQYKQHMSTEQLLLMEHYDLLLARVEEVMKEGKGELTKDVFKLLILVYSLAPPGVVFEDEEELIHHILMYLQTVEQKEDLGWISLQTQKILLESIRNPPSTISKQRSVTTNKKAAMSNAQKQKVQSRTNKKGMDSDEDEDWGDIPSSDEEEEENEDESAVTNDEWADFDPFSKDAKDKKLSTSNSKQSKSAKAKQIEENEDDDDDEGWDNDDWDDFDPFEKNKPTGQQQEQKPAPIIQSQISEQKLSQHSDLDIVRARAELEDAVHYCFDRLRTLNNQRNSMLSFRHLIPYESSTLRPEMIGYNSKAAVFGKREQESVLYEPLVKQFVGQLSDQESSLNITDIKHNRSLLRSLSTTFGRFMFQSKPKLITDDCSAVVIFVVGGITAAEICDMRKIIEYHNNTQGSDSPFYNRMIYFGSTVLSTPEQVYREIFVTDKKLN